MAAPITDNARTLPRLVHGITKKYATCEAVEDTTYEQLQELVNRYVTGLKRVGVGHEDAVCLFFGTKHVHAVALALAIMRVGATHVPLEPSFPVNRLAGQCRTVGSSVKLLVHGPAPDDAPKATSVARAIGVPVEASSVLFASTGDTSDVSSWDDKALVLFTSGSTGPPKATAYQHKHLTLSLEACAQAYDFTDKTRVCNIVPYIWDGGNFDIFGALICGGAVCFCHNVVPGHIEACIKEKRCTWVLIPPSLIAELEIEALGTLDMLVSGGEVVDAGQFRKWAAQIPDTRLVNGFGITEAGIMMATYEWPREPGPHMDWQSIPIGTPFAENKFFIDGEMDELVTAGPQIPGEYLGGVSPSTFIAPPSAFSDKYHAMRTGDRAWRDDFGLYHIGGRIDRRLSILSLRIEPAETEAPALSIGSVDFAYLLTFDLPNGQAPALLLTYHILGDQTPDGFLETEQYEMYTRTYERQLRERLAEEVPNYQLPSTYLPLGHIPRLINSNKEDPHRIKEIVATAYERQLADFKPFSVTL